MKLIAEYLDHALSFERLAAHEKNPTLKADFEKQVAAYRKLAAKRAAELGLEPPMEPEIRTETLPGIRSISTGCPQPKKREF